MKRKGVCVMVGLVLVSLLTGMLGVYSASGATLIGLTYRLNGRGGVKIETPSGLGAEVLVSTYGRTDEDSTSTNLGIQPAVLYRFQGSSDTSLYVGIGYLFYTSTYENWTSARYNESGLRLMAGMQSRVTDNIVFDIRVSAYSNNWTDTWDSLEETGTYTGLYAGCGLSING